MNGLIIEKMLVTVLLIHKKRNKHIGVKRIKKTGRWSAIIYINSKAKHIGNFLTEEDAHEAYKEELKKLNYKNRYLTVSDSSLAH